MRSRFRGSHDQANMQIVARASFRSATCPQQQLFAAQIRLRQCSRHIWRRASGGGSGEEAAPVSGSSGEAAVPADELPAELQDLCISEDGQYLIGEQFHGRLQIGCGCCWRGCSALPHRQPARRSSCCSHRRTALPCPALLRLPADSKTGKVVNEFGATRFDVAVRGG